MINNFTLQPTTQPFSECRALCPGDAEAVRALCAECFPINYPDSWFDYITSNKVPSPNHTDLLGKPDLLGFADQRAGLVKW